MAFKVNYGFQKAERDRAKKAKKEAKAREREASGQTRPDDTSHAPNVPEAESSETGSDTTGA